MSFASDSGYVPSTVSDLMNQVRLGVNAQFGTTYDSDTFVGTNFYKYFYALIQRLQENEIRTAEIVQKLQSYFTITNEKLGRPNTTHPGLFDYFKARGYLISSKAPILADAGKLYVAVLVDSAAPDYAAKKLQICQWLAACVPAGIITQGTELQAIVLSNGQSFDYRFNLPTKIPIKLKLTITTSSNNQSTILSTLAITNLLFANINARYRLGLAFEPQRYFSVGDAPWASSVKLEYSTDGGTTWLTATYAAAYNELLTFLVTDITVVQI